MGMCGPRLRNGYGFFAFSVSRTDGRRRRKVRVDAHANNLLASLGEDLMLLATEI